MIGKLFDAVFNDKPAAEINCPVCGYYCLGKGGVGCIDKPFMVEAEASRPSPRRTIADEAKVQLGIS